MGRRGPAPKPTRLRLLAGNPGHRPINGKEPQPKVEIPSCPKHLGREARCEWKRIARELKALGLLSKIDRAGLAAYCVSWGRWVEAEDKLREHGTIVKSPNGFAVQSPFLSVANQAMRQMTKLLAEFGMTPSSRTRVHSLPTEEPKKGGFDFRDGA